MWLRRQKFFLWQKWTDEYVQHIDVCDVRLIEPRGGEEHVKKVIGYQLGSECAEYQCWITMGRQTTWVADHTLQKITYLHHWY